MTSDYQDVDRLMTVPEAVSYLRISIATLARMRGEGKGPPYMKIGRRVLYRKSSLDLYLHHNVVDNQGENHE